MVALISVLLGGLTTFCVQRFGFSHNLGEESVLYSLGAVSFFLAGLVLKLICGQARWTSIPFMLLGIAFGVFADAAYDFYVNHYDQNLWPFGIIVWWVISPIPIAGGLALGMAIRSREGG
jgi:hypothetical protein